MADTSEFTLSDAEQELLPSAAEVSHFAAHGWYLSKKLLDDDEIEALAAASERFYRGERDRTLPVRPPNLAYWEPAHGPVQRHNDYIHYESAEIGKILRKPLIGAVAALLAQVDEIRAFQATLIYKPPVSEENTNLVPWHVDRHYWQTCTSERMLTAFIPFHDCGMEMGTITMVDGSNRWQDIAGDDSTRHFAQRDRQELEAILRQTARQNRAQLTTVPMVIPKGPMSFHHCRTYHGSGHNLSPQPRRAISFHLQDAQNRWQPFRRPDGSQVVYNHDVLVRKTDDGTPDYSDPEYCPVLWRS
jgi:ectoine hydroxylase-related dioxygenase (phytanoyl-CoA dioxygenase family)